MRAYSDVYLGDVVENQGKLFDYVANTYPDKDTEDFINAYMTSKTRQSIDQAKAYVNTNPGYSVFNSSGVKIYPTGTIVEVLE